MCVASATSEGRLRLCRRFHFFPFKHWLQSPKFPENDTWRDAGVTLCCHGNSCQIYVASLLDLFFHLQLPKFVKWLIFHEYRMWLVHRVNVWCVTRQSLIMRLHQLNCLYFEVHSRPLCQRSIQDQDQRVSRPSRDPVHIKVFLRPLMRPRSASRTSIQALALAASHSYC